MLTPAVDYATSKNLYVIIDFHQIDVITTGTSAADARTFWTDIAPRFANYTNVIYEPFNEPTEPSSSWAALKPVVQSFVDTIRPSAPRNVIIVPSHSWDQHPGDAANNPPSGTNLMYTAHIYPSNWNTAFQNQVATAVAKVPVFITEWGYGPSDPASFGTGLRTTVDGERRELDRLGDGQRLDPFDVRRQLPHDADQLRDVGEDLACCHREQQLGAVTASAHSSPYRASRVDFRARPV